MHHHPFLIVETDIFIALCHALLLFLTHNHLYLFPFFIIDNMINASILMSSIWFDMGICEYDTEFIFFLFMESNNREAEGSIINHHCIVRNNFLDDTFKCLETHCLGKYWFRSITCRETIHQEQACLEFIVFAYKLTDKRLSPILIILLGRPFFILNLRSIQCWQSLFKNLQE